MFNFTKSFSLVFLEFLDIHSFVTLSCLNKEYLEDICYYFKAKKSLFNTYKIKKTLDNSLLKIPQYIQNRGRDPYNTSQPSRILVIVKVVKSSSDHSDERGKGKLKIYFWVVSHPEKIGKALKGRKYVIYPEWCFLKKENINDETLIPFR